MGFGYYDVLEVIKIDVDLIGNDATDRQKVAQNEAKAIDFKALYSIH